MNYPKNKFLCKIQMTYKKIDVSQGVDINKTRESKECDICHYWHFLNKDVKFPREAFSFGVSLFLSS